MKKKCLHVKIFQPLPPPLPPTPVQKKMVRPLLVLCHLETQQNYLSIGHPLHDGKKIGEEELSFQNNVKN